MSGKFVKMVRFERCKYTNLVDLVKSFHPCPLLFSLFFRTRFLIYEYLIFTWKDRRLYSREQASQNYRLHLSNFTCIACKKNECTCNPQAKALNAGFPNHETNPSFGSASFDIKTKHSIFLSLEKIRDFLLVRFSNLWPCVARVLHVGGVDAPLRRLLPPNLQRTRCSAFSGVLRSAESPAAWNAHAEAN